MSRSLLVTAAALAAAVCFAPGARADPTVFVGISDDWFKWRPDVTLPVARDLGATAVRVTLRWHPGETALRESDRDELNRFVPAAFGLRVVVAVYGAADDAPRTRGARLSYCRYVADVLRRYPTVNDVVIWNEPNLSLFWRPQFDDGGASAAPAAYAELLAECWDELHALRNSVNVVSNMSSRGNDRPRATSNVSHSPVMFVRGLGDAYRRLGRDRPLLDTVGLHPYSGSNEPPSFDHGNSTQISQGDIPKLIATFGEAFVGTAQPLLGCPSCPRVWLLESGFQTRPAASKQTLYTGMETDSTALADRATNAAMIDHSSQLRAALTLAYCQPAVGAFFNFLLQDEPELANWQSGLLWADGTPKTSFAAFRDAAREIGRGQIDCAARPASPSPGSREPPASASLPRGVDVASRSLPAAQPSSGSAPAVRVSASVRSRIVRELAKRFPRGIRALRIVASRRAKGWYLADGFERGTRRPVAVWFRTTNGRFAVVSVATNLRQARGPAAAPCDLRPAFGRPRC